MPLLPGEAWSSPWFAVLRAGAAYVPVDPDYPAARVEFMLADAGPALLLTVKDTAERLPRTDVPAVMVDDAPLTEEPVRSAPHWFDHHRDHSYTSGSTGRPKGAVVTHAAIVNAVWMRIASGSTVVPTGSCRRRPPRSTCPSGSSSAADHRRHPGGRPAGRAPRPGMHLA